jgi:hypothetical protein
MMFAALVLAVLALVFGVLALNGKVNNAIPVILVSLAVMLVAMQGGGWPK